MPQRARMIIDGVRIRAGEIRDLRLKVSETFTGDSVLVPLRVIRSRRPGPVVLVSAAIHGDEINGTGIVRELTYGEPPPLRCGTLICMPVVNVFGFETHSRDMPDRRDLNRCFPGAADGSLSSRVAQLIMSEVVRHCDYGIDLHSAATRRTNYPNVRGDLANPGVRSLASTFGCELIVNGKGPEGSLRRAACAAGCPMIILEAGEVHKIEPGVRDIGIRGIRNVLIGLGMLAGELQRPAYQTTVRRTTWVRADLGGLLRFHVAPGDIVEGGQPIASNESLFGDARSVLISPAAGIVLGMATHPAVKPGEPVCHLAIPGRSIASIRKALAAAPATLHQQVREDLATNITVMDGQESWKRARRRASSATRSG